MKKTEKGYTNVRNYDTYASYNADTERNDATISFVEQDNSVWVRDKQYSMNAECYVGSDVSGISTTGNWFLAGEATFTSYTDVNIIGSAVHTHAGGMGGLFVLNLRSDQTQMNPNYTFQWLCKVGSDSKEPVLRYVIDGKTIKLYCKVFGGQYNRIHIRIFNQVNRAGNAVHKEAFFTLKDSTTIIPEADVPSGTDIADVPYITKTDANNKFLPILATTSLVKNNPNVGYIKFAEIDTKGQYGNKAIILSVSSAYTTAANWSDGLYMINVRGNGASISTCRAYCFVDYRSGASKIKLYFAVSGSKVEFYREVRTAQELTQLGFKVLNVENFENGSLWDFKLIESSKTTSDATLDTPIGTLTEIPNRGQVYFADNTQKIQQINATSSAARRLLLGEAHDTAQQDAVYKSSDLTYNPSTKTLTVPTIKNPNSSWVHAAEGVAGQSGYVKIATIKINTTLTDQPLAIQFTGRNYREPVYIYIRFNSENNTDPTLASFYCASGTSRLGEYLHKSAIGTWDLYIRKGQGWDKIVVLSCENPYAFLSPNPNYSITWQDELVTTLPTGYVESIVSTKRINISGNAGSATKLATPRSFNLGGGLTGTAVNFDGTGNVVLNGGLKKVFSTNGGKYNYQYHRFLSIGSAETPLPATSQNYHFTFLVQSSETAEREGILDINLRTNGSTQNSYLDCKWLLLSSNNSAAHPKIAYGFSNNAGATYADLFIEHTEAYKYYHFVLLSFNVRAALNVTSGTIYTLYNSSETGDTTTTDKATSYEVYASIAQAGQEIHGHTTDAGYSIIKDDTVASNVATIVNGFVKTANTAVRSTDSAFLQSLEGLCHKSVDSSLDLRRRTEYICGQQVLSDTEEAGKAFYGSSANPLVISVPLKDPADAVAGGKVNVNTIRFYYAETYWQELFFCVNTPRIYTRWVANGTARPWYKLIKEDSTIEYNAWVAKSTKLATSRKIGFADFNGTASISLNAIQGANVTRWSSSGTLKPNQWIRLIRMKFSQVYSSVSITLAIEEGEQHRFRGIINFTAWVGSDLNPSVNNSTAIWYSLYQVDKNSFGDVTQYIRMIPVAPTDNDANGYVDVYVMSPLGAISYGWHVINDRQINNASFTLKADTTAIIDDENFPTSYKSSGFQGVLATGDDVEYGTWVTKATTATNADVANKTKYPIVFKRNGASITNWFADTTFAIDIPEELLDYSAPTGIALKVPEISVANKVANKLSLTVNGSTTEYDGSAGARVSIKANCTHIVKANSSSSLGTLYPEQTGHPSAVTVPVSMLPLEPYNSAAGGLNDGDTLILHVPNSMANPTANYVWCVKLDITTENTTDNIIPLIHGQSAGTPVFWNTSTTIPAGFYQFVYSATLGGLVYMYRNTATT